MSPELQKFFLEIHEWIEQGCPEHKVFLRSQGLCANLEDFSTSLRVASFYLLTELRRIFRLMGDETYIPFNRAPNPNYSDEACSRTMYQNPARLAFIKQQVELIKNA